MVYSSEYYQNNKEKFYARAFKWRKKNPSRLKLLQFRAKLKTNYGLSYQEYLKILETQNNSCAICNATGPLSVDHCHDSLKIRGLLCRRCNLGLGQFQDSRILLNKAIEYLNDTQD